MSFVKDFFTAVENVLDLPANLYPPVKDKSRTRLVQDVRYADDPVCLADLYLPDVPARKRPVLLYIHGGGFVAGDKAKRRGLSFWYASLGIAVLNVNYGLSPDHVYPQPLAHLVSALDWIVDHAAEYKLDPSKIIVSGDSAGAFYACMLTALVTHPELCDQLGVSCRANVGACVLNCGLYDIPAAFEQKIPFRLDRQIFYSMTGTDYTNFDSYEYKQLCSPLDCIDASFPPAFVIYAKKDIFCAGQAELLLDRLRQNGVYHESFRTEEFFNNHCFSLLWLNRRAQRANQLVASFLGSYIRNELKNRPLNADCEYEGELPPLPDADADTEE